MANIRTEEWNGYTIRFVEHNQYITYKKIYQVVLKAKENSTFSSRVLIIF